MAAVRQSKANFAKGKPREAWAGFGFPDAVISAVVAAALAGSRTDLVSRSGVTISSVLSNTNFV